LIAYPEERAITPLYVAGLLGVLPVDIRREVVILTAENISIMMSS